MLLVENAWEVNPKFQALNSKQIQITKIQMTKNKVEARICWEFFLALGDNPDRNRISKGGNFFTIDFLQS